MKKGGIVGQLIRRKSKPDCRSYKKFKFWDTARLQFVIDDPFNRGEDGADYAPYIEEITDIYYIRLNKIAEKQRRNS